METRMPKKPLWQKIIERSIAAIVLLFLLTLAIVQAGQRVLRHRAERLLADLRQLHADGDSWAEMQRMMTRWGAYGQNYDGACTPQKCEYRITLEDWIGETTSPGSGHGFLGPVAPFIELFHWHAASLYADITVADGKVAQWRVHVWTEVPRGAGLNEGRYTLMASAGETPLPSSYYWQWPARQPHPEYSIIEPTGCLSCIGITAEFTPSTQPNEVKLLTNFNLNCITRWSPCVGAGDIFPEVWQQLQEERKLRRANDARLADCSFSLEELTRASDLILRINIVSEEVDPADSTQLPFYSARLLEVVHGVSRWKAGTALRVKVTPNYERPTFSAKRGAELILFEPLVSQGEDSVEPQPCGVVAMSPETLARVRGTVASMLHAQPNGAVTVP
jgi:hypothetical protein